MWTGQRALASIDQTLQSVRNEVVRIDQNLASLSAKLAGQQQRRAQILNEIATVRLAEIEKGTLQVEMDAADRRASTLLGEREVAFAKLNKEIDALNDEVENSEQHRQSLLAELSETSQNIVGTEARVQESLKGNQAYAAQLEASREAESIANEASLKSEDAFKDMTEKAKPYKSDPLFSYLWERGFGTTEYSANFFSRFMDSWIAKLIDFEPARVNYWNLTEIPKRLQQHADRVARQADEAVMALQQIELDALAQAGVPEMEARLDKLRESLDAHDDKLEQIEARLNEKLSDRSGFVAGQDQFIAKCLETLTAVINHQSLRAVHRYAQVTHSPTDDRLVIELQELEQEVDELEQNAQDVRRSHSKQIARLKEIEEVRRNFKNSRYDDVRSGFTNQSLLQNILAQFAQGLVSGRDVWKVIKRGQRYRNVGSIPDFGSGGFGGDLGNILDGVMTGGSRRRRNSSWHLPRPRRGGGGFNFPRGGGRRGSGGGFRTGGGF